jgi:hypothetical protein
MVPGRGSLLFRVVGWLLVSGALLYLVPFVKNASARTLLLQRSPEGTLCGRLEEARPWGTAVRDLPPGSVLAVRHATETRTRFTRGRNGGGGSRVTYQVEVLAVITTGEDIRFDYRGAADYARALLASAPGGPLQAVKTPYPWGAVLSTLFIASVGALAVWAGRRRVRDPMVPPPA